jgi:predicted nucleic acid-binding Zn ribbon protein
MTPWRRSPRPLAAAVDVVRDELEPQTLLARAQRSWPNAVGAAIAAEAQPTAERGGVLTVSCSASVWAQELDLMAPVILERLNQMLDTERVVRLRCVALPPDRRAAGEEKSR